jgi:PAS domain S-box-containing protein
MPGLDVSQDPAKVDCPPVPPESGLPEPHRAPDDFRGAPNEAQATQRALGDPFARLTAAAVLVTVAVIARDFLAHFGATFPPLLCFGLAIMGSALLGDVWAGVFATALSVFAAIRFPIPGFTPSPLTRRGDAIEAALLFSVGCLLSLIVETYQRNREKLEMYRVWEARRESNDCYRFLFSSMHEAFFMADIVLDESSRPIDYRFVEANHAMEVQYGLPLERIIGNTALNVDPDLSTIWIEAFGHIALTGEQVRFNHLLSFKNGQYEVSVYQIRKGRFAAIFRDVGERRRSEELLRTSRAKLEAAMSSMADAIVITDAVGKYVDFNEAFAAICRFKSKEECARSLSELRNIIEVLDAHGDPEPVENWAVPRALRGETGTSVEYTIRRKDTGETWIGSYTFSPIRAQDGTIVGSVMTARDITEQKRAARLLATTLERFYLILSNLNSGVLLVNKDGRIEFANQAFCKLHRIAETPAELIAAPQDEIHAKLRMAHFLVKEDFQHLREIAAKGLAVYGEEVHMQGGVTFLRDFVPLRLDGESYGSLWVLTDITARKRAEEALFESQRQNKFLADMILGSSQPLGIAYPDGRLVMVNHAYEEMLGYSLDELRLIDWRTVLTPPEYSEVTRTNLEELCRTGVPVRFEKECIRKDGTRIPVELLAHLVKDGAGQPHFFAFMTDITERKRAREELKKLNRTLKALSRSNQELLHATHEEAYLHEICHCLQEDCGYAMVWIGEAMYDAARSVRPIASSGGETEFLETMGVRWDESTHGKSHIGTAIRTGQISTCRDMLTDPRMAHCRQLAMQRGYRSLLAIPLKARDKIWGAIVIYSPEPDAFSEGEVELLTELVEDLEFGIQTLRTRAAHVRAERALRESEELLGLFVEHAPAALAMFDNRMRYLYVSRHWRVMYGIGDRELHGVSHYDLFPTMSQEWKEAHRRGLAGEILRKDADRFQKPDGTEQWLRWEIRPWRSMEGEVGGIVIFTEDITERRHSEIVLAESEQKLRELAASLLTVQEEERRSLARELHDDLTQRLAFLSIELGNLARQMPDACGDSQTRIFDLQEQALRTSSEIRRISHGLHPSAIVDFGLSIALEEFCEEFQKSQGISVEFEGLIDDTRLDDARATCLYRIAQESMRNASNHGQATRIGVTLRVKRDVIELRVEDNGSGFFSEPNHRKKGLGVTSMTERIRLVNGTFSLVSQPGLGTEMIATVPLLGVHHEASNHIVGG